MPDVKEMTEDEIRERKKLLTYQAFYLEVKRNVRDLESFINTLEKNGTKKEKE